MLRKNIIYTSILFVGFIFLAAVGYAGTTSLGDTIVFFGATGDSVNVGINEDNPQSELNITGDLGVTGTIAGTFVGDGSGLTSVGGSIIIESGFFVLNNFSAQAYGLNESNITIPAGTLDSNDILKMDFMEYNWCT